MSQPQSHKRSLSSAPYKLDPRDPLSPMSSSSTSELSHRQAPTRASRILFSVKRSLTPTTKRNNDFSKSGMYSTPAERTPHPTPQRFREPDPFSSRPTIEQIAMGLHVSRTPHLRPLNSSRYAYSAPNTHRPSPSTPFVLPPPPSRSSLKKHPTIASSSSSPAVSPPFSAASVTSTTIASAVGRPPPPDLPVPSRKLGAIKHRMARFLPTRSTSAPSSMMSTPRNSEADFPMPKKAVRFSTSDDL